MKWKWFVTLFAAVPLSAALLALQSCAGEGGPTSSTGGLPGVTAAFRALWSPDQQNASYIGSEACGQAACHGGATDCDEEIYTHWKETVHYTKGVGCERCHGPGSAHAADPDDGKNIVKLPQSSEMVVCGQCHGPIFDQHATSQHSKLIQDPVEEAIVNPAQYGKNSRCVLCHSGLFKAEQMEGLDIGTLTNEQIQEIAEETLTVSPHSADCVSCHNPHAKTGNLTDDGKEVQLWRKTFNTDTTAVAPGSLAASFTAFDHVCAQCHNGRGADASDAKLTSSTSRPNMHDSNQFNMLLGFAGYEGVGPPAQNTAHATAPGQCSKCHMPDSRHTFTVSFDKGCAPCHTTADAAARLTSVKDDILNRLLSLRTKLDAWAQQAFSNPLFWEYTTNITAEGFTPPSQASVPLPIKRARHNYYFVIRSGDYGAHNAPYAKHLLTVAEQQVDSVVSDGRSFTANPYVGLTTQQKLAIIEADRARARKADMKELDN